MYIKNNYVDLYMSNKQKQENMKTTIKTTKTGAGHYEVTLFLGHELMGTFETTDMQLVDDIHSFNNNDELDYHEDVADLLDTIYAKLGLCIIGDNYSGKYVCDTNGALAGDRGSAMIFKSFEEAETVIENNEWSGWAYVEGL